MPETLLTAWLRKPTTKSASTEPTSPSLKFNKTYATAAAAAPPGLVKRDKTSSYTAALPPLSSHNSPPPAPPAPPLPPSGADISNANSNPIPSPNPSPAFTPLRPLPPNLTLTSPTAPLLPAFKRLNQSLFPIPYPPAFYAETLADAPTAALTLFALWHPSTTSSTSAPSASPSEEAPTLIGAIRCRLDAPTTADEKATLYISTLCVLPAYREHGCATHLLARVTATAAREYGVGSVTAHVWEANAAGRAWYARRGFEEVGSVEGYYRRLRPGRAVLVRRRVGVWDALGGGEGGMSE